MDLNDPYCYSQLLSPRHTRSIVLHSSKTDDGRITCELVQVDIDNAPRYEALSYTWNSEAPSEPLDVLSTGDSGGVQTLLVTPNCARALTILRKRLGRRRVAKVGLWVDAICINQSDNKEKGLQVAMMAEIYRTAKSVLIWLGDGYAPPNLRSLVLLPILRPFTDYHLTWREYTGKTQCVTSLLRLMEPHVYKAIEKGMSGLLGRSLLRRDCRKMYQISVQGHSGRDFANLAVVISRFYLTCSRKQTYTAHFRFALLVTGVDAARVYAAFLQVLMLKRSIVSITIWRRH